MEDELPLEEQIFQPDPLQSLMVADLIFDSPKPQHTSKITQRRGSNAVMEYTRHPSDTGQEPHVHFEDGKTTRLRSYDPLPMAGPPPPQQYPQQPQAAYPLQQNQQQPPFQQQHYYPPPPPQQSPHDPAAPIPIPANRDRQNSMASNRSPTYGSNQPAYQPQPQSSPYGSSPGYQRTYPSPQAVPPPPQAAAPPQPAPPQLAPQPSFGHWQPGYFVPPQGAPPNSDPWQQPGAPRNPSVSYLPGPGAAPFPGQYYAMPPVDRNRTGSSSSYASRSSYRSGHRDWDRDSPISESDEDSSSSMDERPSRRRHSYAGSSSKHHHGHGRKSSFHGDKAHKKYSGGTDHASLGDTLSLIWDGLNGFGKPKR